MAADSSAKPAPGLVEPDFAFAASLSAFDERQQRFLTAFAGLVNDDKRLQRARNVSTSAMYAGVTRRTVESWRKSEDFVQAYNEAEQYGSDMWRAHVARRAMVNDIMGIFQTKALIEEYRDKVPTFSVYNDNRQQLICSLDQIHAAMREIQAAQDAGTLQLQRPAETDVCEATEYDEEPPF